MTEFLKKSLAQSEFDSTLGTSMSIYPNYILILSYFYSEIIQIFYLEKLYSQEVYFIIVLWADFYKESAQIGFSGLLVFLIFNIYTKLFFNKSVSLKWPAFLKFNTNPSIHYLDNILLYLKSIYYKLHLVHWCFVCVLWLYYISNISYQYLICI